MENIVNFPGGPVSPLLGPFAVHSIVVEGRVIPLMSGSVDGADMTSIIIDGRFSISVPNALAYQVAWICAQAIAVASGYSHVGAESKDAPFAPVVSRI